MALKKFIFDKTLFSVCKSDLNKYSRIKLYVLKKILIIVYIQQKLVSSKYYGESPS